MALFDHTRRGLLYHKNRLSTNCGTHAYVVFLRRRCSLKFSVEIEGFLSLDQALISTTYVLPYQRHHSAAPRFFLTQLVNNRTGAFARFRLLQVTHVMAIATQTDCLIRWRFYNTPIV